MTPQVPVIEISFLTDARFVPGDGWHGYIVGLVGDTPFYEIDLGRFDDRDAALIDAGRVLEIMVITKAEE